MDNLRLVNSVVTIPFMKWNIFKSDWSSCWCQSNGQGNLYIN